ncbi:MAG TPA: hypothetical protein VFN88_12420 [Caulobacteraceae bacterium]|nr:hypothetical protein [Caulobacteraceae bacterium]
MPEFSIAQAARAGFGVARRSFATIIIWYVVSVLVAATGLYLAGRLLGPALAELQAVQASATGGTPPDAQAALAAVSKMMGGLIMMIPFYLVLGAITTTAANRAVLHPEQSGFGYLRLGSDELRMIVVLLVIGIILFVVYMIGALIAVVAATAIGGASGNAANPQALTPMISLAILPVLIIVGLIALKFCAAPAQTLDTRSINIFGSWSVTKGRFGPIFLVYLINCIGFVLIYFALLYLSFYGAAAANGQTLVEAMRPDPASSLNLANPGTVIRLLIGSVIAVFGQLMLVCPGASIYQQLAGRGADEEAF